VWQLRSASDGAACASPDVSEDRACDEWCARIAADWQIPTIAKELIGYSVVAARFNVLDRTYEPRARGRCFFVDVKDPACDSNADAPPLPGIAPFADGEL
jgi:hypothetical protein